MDDTITATRFVSCGHCDRGAIVCEEPRPIGRASNGETVYNGTTERRYRCEICKGAGRIRTPQPDPEPPTTHDADSITWGGHDVDAPGFTQDQFERAMVRAFCDDLQIKELRGETYIVHHAGLTHGYRVTRESCTCPAGEVGTPCKHRAILAAHLDIRAPYIDRQWRKLQADRPATSAEVA